MQPGIAYPSKMEKITEQQFEKAAKATNVVKVASDKVAGSLYGPPAAVDWEPVEPVLVSGEREGGDE